MSALLAQPVSAAPAPSPTVASPPLVLSTSSSAAPTFSTLEARRRFKDWCVEQINGAILHERMDVSLNFAEFRHLSPQVLLDTDGSRPTNSVPVHSVLREIGDDFWNDYDIAVAPTSISTESSAVLFCCCNEDYFNDTALRGEIQRKHPARIELVFLAAQRALSELRRNGQPSRLIPTFNCILPAAWPFIVTEASLRLSPLGGKITRILGEWHVTYTPVPATAAGSENSTSATKTPG